MFFKMERNFSRERVLELQSEYQAAVEQLRDINDAAQVAGRKALNESETREWNRIKEALEPVERELYIIAKSRNIDAQTAAREVIANRDIEYRLTPERAASGKQLRGLLESGALGSGVPIELREAGATTSTMVAGAVPIFVKDFIEPLEKGIIYGKVGIQIKTGLSGEHKYPVAPYIEATMEDETIKLPDNTLDFGSLTPKPKRVGITAPLTGTANVLTDGAVYNWVVSELVKAVARYLNRWMFMAAPVKEGVHGVFSYNAVSNPIKQKIFKGSVPTYKELLAMRGEVMSSGAYNDGTYAFVMSGMMQSILESERRFDTGETTIIDTNGNIANLPVFLTEEIEATAAGEYNLSPKHVGFGRFSDCMAHQFGDMSLIIDPFSDHKKGITNITLQTHWAVDLIRKGSFVIGTVANG